MTFTILWERQGAYVRYQDKVGFAEFMGAVLDIHAHPNYASTKYVIHDMLAASELDFTGMDMTTMVAHELGARFTNPGVRPVVVSGNPKMEEMTRVFNTLTRLEVGCFASLQEARAWLGRTTAPPP